MFWGKVVGMLARLFGRQQWLNVQIKPKCLMMNESTQHNVLPAHNKKSAKEINCHDFFIFSNRALACSHTWFATRIIIVCLFVYLISSPSFARSLLFFLRTRKTQVVNCQHCLMFCTGWLFVKFNFFSFAFVVVSGFIFLFFKWSTYFCHSS